MSKIIVFSDSHGFSDNMMKAVQTERPGMLIFCGDGENDLLKIEKQYPELIVKKVCGNADQYSSSPKTLCFAAYGKTFFVAHGNEHRVKRKEHSLEIMTAAMEKNADIVLHGHTHSTYTESTIGMNFMNPGTCKKCPDTTYGVIEIGSNLFNLSIKHISEI